MEPLLIYDIRHGKESGDGYKNNKFDEVDWQINNQTCAVLQPLAEASIVLEGKKCDQQLGSRLHLLCRRWPRSDC